MAVENQLRQLSIPYKNVNLGEVELKGDVPKDMKRALAVALEEKGFALLEDKQATLIEKIKTVIVDMIHRRQAHPTINYSAYISEKVHHEYKYISSLFSSVEGITIEKFIILQKVERIKELLFYDEMTLKKIASTLGYSSIQHLSNQFKKTTGLSPTEFKALKNKNRKPLDRLN